MDDGLQTFLQVAAQHRLLSAAEEKVLGRRVQAGILSEHPIKLTEDARLARNELVLCNIRLVVSLVRYYKHRGLTTEEIVQEGIIGLNRAAEKYDPDTGRFTTYATIWIKQAIQRGLQRGGTAIRLPSTVAVIRVKVRAYQLRHPEATTQQIADSLDVDEEDVENALVAAEVVTSLDRAIVTDDHEHTMMDAVADPHADDPHDLVDDDLTDELWEALAALPREHRRVVILNFGLNGKPPMPIKDVAARVQRNGEPISLGTAKGLRDEALEFLGHRLDHHA